MAVIAVPPSGIGILIVDFFGTETIVGKPGLTASWGAKVTLNLNGGVSDRLVSVLEEEKPTKVPNDRFGMQLNEVADSGAGLYRCDCGLQVTVLPRAQTGFGLNSFFNAGDKSHPGRFFPRVSGGLLGGSAHELAMGVRGGETGLDARASDLRKESNISLPMRSARLRTALRVCGEEGVFFRNKLWPHSGQCVNNALPWQAIGETGEDPVLAAGLLSCCDWQSHPASASSSR